MTTVEAITRQLNAMQQQNYEIGLHQGGERENVIPRVWNVEGVMKSLGWLRHSNAQNRDIWIRPYGEHNLTLIDDVKMPMLQTMKEQGFQPTAVVETSPHNFQVWLNHGIKLGKELSTYVAGKLARRFDGDTSSADWRHFGRLAGFTNRKEKYMDERGLFPYVLLREAKGQVYEQAGSFIHQSAQEWKLILEKRQSYRPLAPSGRTPKSIKTIEQFRGDPRYGGDPHRSDQAYAVYAIGNGVPDAEIARAIASRDLKHKGPPARQEGYIARTLEKARSRSLGR